MTVRIITPSEERRIRRFIFRYDPEFAMHPNVKTYFMTESKAFGIMVAEEAGEIKALAGYTIMVEKGKSFIHYWLGDIAHLEEIRTALELPCQAFFQDGVDPGPGWRAELKVTPGYVIDHPAYSGVFTRLVPRFSGTVYEHD